MTVCFTAQEPEAKLAPDDEQKADLAVMMKDLEALLARVGSTHANFTSESPLRPD